MLYLLHLDAELICEAHYKEVHYFIADWMRAASYRGAVNQKGQLKLQIGSENSTAARSY